MKIYLLTSLILFASFSNADDCPAPTICKEIHQQYDKSHEKPKNHKEFKKLISLLTTATVKKCEIPGHTSKVPAYQVCFDQGFTTKVNEKGQPVLDQKFKGPEDEQFVLTWFSFADKSKFPEGKKLTRGKDFQSTLDGGWAEMFD